MKPESQTILESLRSYPVTGFLVLLHMSVYATGIPVTAEGSTARWLEKVKPHVPELLKQREEELKRERESRARTPALSEKAFFAEAIEKVKPQKSLETGAAIVGRDADFSWF